MIFDNQIQKFRELFEEALSLVPPK